MHRFAFCALLVACSTDSPVNENPMIDPSPGTSCGISARLVHGACTKLGPTDGCVETHDVCIALCDHRTTCSMVGDLRILNGFAVAPDGYCVECTR